MVFVACADPLILIIRQKWQNNTAGLHLLWNFSSMFCQFSINLESEWSDSFTFNHNFLQLFKLVFSFKVVAVVKSIPLFELISH